MTKIRVNLGEASYDITVGRGALGRAGEIFNLDRRVLIVTDEGVPAEYSLKVKGCSANAEIITVPMGEGSKSLECFGEILTKMAEMNMTRRDAVVAVGGGVVGDLAGFAAASYMRGIDFYNIPTTVLSQVDSSVGGKTAVNLGGIKNIVGAFHQPRGVIIDPDCLLTLDKRQIANGLAEAVKMAVTSSEELFMLFERYSFVDILANIEEIIVKSIKIKAAVVEADEKESGLRRILNLGHTLGHGIEAEEELHGLYHGECVALGMLPVLSEDTRKRVIPVLNKLGLPTEYNGDIEKALSYITHDKKCVGGGVMTILSDSIGSFRIEKLTVDEFSLLVRRVYK